MSTVVSRNPFSTRFIRPGVIPWHSTTTSPSALLKSLKDLNNRVVISGPHGSGKSTLLCHFCSVAREQGYKVYYLRCRSWIDVMRAIRLFFDVRPRHDFVCIDSLEILSISGWFLCSVADLRGIRVVGTVHERPWWCTWPVLINTKTSFKTFDKIVRELMTKFCRTEIINFSREMLQEVFKRNSGNLRESFFELYDHYESCSRTTLHMKKR
jgi:energy-coupling factor transporter ATP-binding protein EcfA2